MDSTKVKIEKIVSTYITLYADEARMFFAAVAEKRNQNTDQFGSLKTDVIQRALYEVPETLYYMFSSKLEESDLQWFQTTEGARWFAGKFPKFRIAEKV